MYKMIDLFSGLGGFRIAFESNGVECIGSSEIDKGAIQTYFSNFNEIPLGDITKIKSDELPDFDILSAGFPCQPFSIGGLRKGFEDTRGTLFFEVARIIKDKQPKAFILENVAGIVSHDKGNTLNKIEEVLNGLGYNFKWMLMNSKDHGIPQNRNRWYCIGFKSGLDIGFDQKNSSITFEFPEKKDLDFHLRDIVKSNSEDIYKISKIAKKNINVYKPSFIDSQRYDNNHILIANDIRPSRCGFRCDGISPCLTAKMGTGGNNVPVVVDQNRKLSESECLAIMGFPTWYKIKKGAMSSYKQIGNSVVVSIVTELAQEMVRVLKESKVPCER